MKTKVYLIAACVAAMLAGCSPAPQPATVVQTPPPVAATVPMATQQPQVVVVQQPAQHSGSGDVLLGAAAGFAAGSLMNSGSRQTEVRNNTTVINRTVYVDRTVPVATPATIPPKAAAVVPAPIPKPEVKTVNAPQPNLFTKNLPAQQTAAKPSLSLTKPSSTSSTSFGGFTKKK